jgi:hypothetical protein
MFLPQCIEQNRNNAKAGIIPAIILLSDQRLAGWGKKTADFRPCARGEKEE